MTEGVMADHHAETEFLDQVLKISVFIWSVKLSICLVCTKMWCISWAHFNNLHAFSVKICSLHKKLSRKLIHNRLKCYWWITCSHLLGWTICWNFVNKASCQKARQNYFRTPNLAYRVSQSFKHNLAPICFIFKSGQGKYCKGITTFIFAPKNVLSNINHKIAAAN